MRIFINYIITPEGERIILNPATMTAYGKWLADEDEKKALSIQDSDPGEASKIMSKAQTLREEAETHERVWSEALQANALHAAWFECREITFRDRVELVEISRVNGPGSFQQAIDYVYQQFKPRLVEGWDGEPTPQLLQTLKTDLGFRVWMDAPEPPPFISYVDQTRLA